MNQAEQVEAVFTHYRQYGWSLPRVQVVDYGIEFHYDEAVQPIRIDNDYDAGDVARELLVSAFPGSSEANLLWKCHHVCCGCDLCHGKCNGCNQKPESGDTTGWLIAKRERFCKECA